MSKLIGIAYNSRITGSTRRCSDTHFHNEPYYAYIGQNDVVDIIEHLSPNLIFYDIINKDGDIKRIFNPIEAYYTNEN